jgi:hypothetical protein
VILKKVIHNKTFKVLKGLLQHANESISVKAFREKAMIEEVYFNRPSSRLDCSAGLQTRDKPTS